MFILIVGSRIRHCSLQLSSKNYFLYLRSGLPYSLFFLILFYLSFFFSINRLFYFILLICVWNLVFVDLVFDVSLSCINTELCYRIFFFFKILVKALIGNWVFIFYPKSQLPKASVFELKHQLPMRLQLFFFTLKFN